MRTQRFETINYSKERLILPKEYKSYLNLRETEEAIKYIKDESEIPKNALRPSKINQRLSLCQAFTNARRLGRSVGMTFEDNHCITSSFVQGWKYMPGKEILKSQILSGYHSTPSAELKIQLQFVLICKKKI